MMRRNAIIACCPGDSHNYLPGTKLDIQNFSNFLRSPRGGSWHPNETVILENPGYEEMLWHVEHQSADYQQIYFSGHGCTRDNKRLLAFKNDLIPDTWLLNKNPRQLIIIDACRTHLASIGSIPESEDVFGSFDGISQARRVFDTFIENSPSGKLIVHATHDGAPSADLTRFGGAFTFTLLRIASQLNTSVKYSPVSIDQLLQFVQTHLKAQGFKQRPGIVYKEGDLRVPFMIDAPQIVNESVFIHRKRTFDIQNNWLPLIGFSLAIFGLIQISNGK